MSNKQTKVKKDGANTRDGQFRPKPLLPPTVSTSPQAYRDYVISYQLYLSELRLLRKDFWTGVGFAPNTARISSQEFLGQVRRERNPHARAEMLRPNRVIIDPQKQKKDAPKPTRDPKVIAGEKKLSEERKKQHKKAKNHRRAERRRVKALERISLETGLKAAIAANVSKLAKASTSTKETYAKVASKATSVPKGKSTLGVMTSLVGGMASKTVVSAGRLGLVARRDRGAAYLRRQERRSKDPMVMTARSKHEYQRKSASTASRLSSLVSTAAGLKG